MSKPALRPSWLRRTDGREPTTAAHASTPTSPPGSTSSPLPTTTVEEAECYSARIVETAVGPVRTVLELGSGGGNNASHMKERFAMTLSDLSPDMLEVSRSINPELTHIQGDMRSLRIPGAQFDAVFVHDAVMYLTTEADIHAMAETAAYPLPARRECCGRPGPRPREHSLHRTQNTAATTTRTDAA